MHPLGMVEPTCHWVRPSSTLGHCLFKSDPRTVCLLKSGFCINIIIFIQYTEIWMKKLLVGFLFGSEDFCLWQLMFKNTIVSLSKKLLTAVELSGGGTMKYHHFSH